MAALIAAKRDRCSNFSRDECRELYNYVRKYASVLENKKSDGATWREKKLTWEMLTAEFNANNAVPRTSTQLRSKYEKLKKDAKIMAAADRTYAYQMGGGRYDPPNFPDRDLLEDIQLFIPASRDGPAASTDCDSRPKSEIDTERYATRRHNEADDNEPVAVAFEMDMIVEGLKTSASEAGDVSDVGEVPGEAARDWSLRKQAANERFAAWADSKRELLELQKDLLLKEFNLKRKNEQELHELEVEIKKAQLESIKLDIAIKKRGLAPTD